MSIVINKLTISHFMSYAENVVIEFDSHRVTQLIGRNGLGKSTIGTALEELLYNKNSRGIKKDDLFNWHTGSKAYTLEGQFTKDGDVYNVKKVVKSTAKVTLTKNGEDISGHTATQTYKLIEEVLACDFTTFTKLVYQSVGSSLDFLKTTDAQRKAFLVNLFDQEQYKEVSERVKAGRKAVSAKLSGLEGSLRTAQSILSSKASLGAPQSEIPIPVFDEEPLVEELTEAKVKVALAQKQKASIAKRSSLDMAVQAAEKTFAPFENLPAPTSKSEELLSVTRNLTVVATRADDLKKRYYDFKNAAGKTQCSACGTHLDTSAAQEAMRRTKEEYDPLYKERQKLEAEVEELRKEDRAFKDYISKFNALEQARKNLKEFDEVNGTQDEIVDASGLAERIKAIESSIRQGRSSVELARTHNESVVRENAKYEAKREQIQKAEQEFDKIQAELSLVAEEVADLDILITGLKDLVGYKLEHSVKVFEEMINHYLSIMTSGKFALGFELDETKLQVVIYNDGNRTSMVNCSTGQQSRINISTLLAIRMLLSTISKVNINLLFLDEVVSYIDPDGINTLVELLQEEDQLNSIIVSHGHTHPYAHKIEVKQDEAGLSILEA